jgi:hypothetical protein
MSNNKYLHFQSDIYQNQSKRQKNGESHGGVRQDKYAKPRVRAASDEPVMDTDPARTSRLNTTIPRPKKHSTKRRLSQLATWVEDPIVFKIQQKARQKGLSTSAVIRKLLAKALTDEESVDETLDMESLRDSLARENRRLGRRLAWLLVWLIYDVGHIKVLSTNTLGMQKGMGEEMLKDILKDADRQTKGRLSRKTPELTGFVDEVEKWLSADEEGRGERRP